MPQFLPTGPMTIKVINDCPEPHEVNILRPKEGKTAGDVKPFLTGKAGGSPPFAPVGEMNGLDTGVIGYAEVTLEPGRMSPSATSPAPKRKDIHTSRLA